MSYEGYPEGYYEGDCDCNCHQYWDPDGLLCLDGYCDGCDDLAGADGPA